MRISAKAAGRKDIPYVIGPDGSRLTLDRLPPPDTVRWVARRKAEIIAAVRGQLLTRAEACRRYRLSEEELAAWEHASDCAGVPGLRVTRLQAYRPIFARDADRSASPHRTATRRN